MLNTQDVNAIKQSIDKKIMNNKQTEIKID